MGGVEISFCLLFRLSLYVRLVSGVFQFFFSNCILSGCVRLSCSVSFNFLLSAASVFKYMVIVIKISFYLTLK